MPGQSALGHTTTPEYSTYSYDACYATCVFTLAAPSVDEVERAPVSCTFVLDTSGSMGGPKLDLMRKASQFSLRQLAEKDAVGVVEFDSQV